MYWKAFFDRLPAITLLALVVVKFIDDGLIYSNAKAAPDSASGFTVPIQSHERTIFVTVAQHERLDPFNWSSFAILILASVVAIQRVRKQNRQHKME